MDNTVIRFWDALRAKWPEPQPEWHQMQPQSQMQIMIIINGLIQFMKQPK